MQTMMTVRNEDLADTLERVGRQWKGAMLELTMRPQDSGHTVMTLTYPSGVDVPPDPGLSPAALRNAELSSENDMLRHQLKVMTEARDASDADAQEARDALNEARQAAE